MQPLCYFALTFLCNLLSHSSAFSTRCNQTQYPWPPMNLRLCCNKCPPGTHLERRDPHRCETQCKPCVGNRYRETYNEEFTCEICVNCNRPNMEYKSLCNVSHNSVCRCKVGYECKEHPCKECLPIPTTTKGTTPPLSTALKPDPFPTPLRDTVWFLVIIGLLSAGIAIVVLTKIKPFMHWISSKHGYLLTKPHAPASLCSEDEDVSRPVQEAGNMAKPQIDAELGLLRCTQEND